MATNNTNQGQTMNDTTMIVTLTRNTDAATQIVFTWTDGKDDCEFLTVGEVSDAQLDAVIAAKGHEGANVDGWMVELN